jgi:hypothetical protein
MGGGLPGRTPLISFVRPTPGLEALCREVRMLFLGQYLIQIYPAIREGFLKVIFILNEVILYS